MSGAHAAALALSLAGTLCGSGLAADSLRHLSTFDWPSASFVGLSGLEVSADGQSFTAVSDRGWILSGAFQRKDGHISGIRLDRFDPILGNDGHPVAARRIADWSDAEGLAMAPEGHYWISFEQWARVARYDPPARADIWIRDHPRFYDHAANRQLEALALHPDGTLYTFPERPFAAGFPIYRLDRKGWTITGHFPEQNGFSVVGADFDMGGKLYLLERKLAFGLWWQNRIRRLTLPGPTKDEIIWTGTRGQFHNLEGIALWRTDGHTRITLVSDDNGNPDEPTQFVEFRLVMDPEPQK